MTKTRSWTKGPGVLGAALLLAVGVLEAVLAAGPAGATLPGANGKVAYANGGIWVAGPGGENPTRLTSSFMDADPSWSPDGKRIAFASSAERCRMEIYAMDADGTGKVRLSEAGANEADHQPSWSPDGEEIVFSRSYEAEMPRVYSVDADGVLGEVAFPNARGFEPAWSPDGRRVAYRATPGNALTSVTRPLVLPRRRPPRRAPEVVPCLPWAGSARPAPPSRATSPPVSTTCRTAPTMTRRKPRNGLPRRRRPKPQGTEPPNCNGRLGQ